MRAPTVKVAQQRMAFIFMFQMFLITALPGALAGVVWGLHLSLTSLSVPALLGAIMSLGVAMANAILLVTFAATLLLNLEVAIFAGVVFSLLLYLHGSSHPEMRSLIPDPRIPERNMLEVEPPFAECPQLKILRIEGSIYFGAVNHVEDYFDALRRKPRHDRFRLSRLPRFRNDIGIEQIGQSTIRKSLALEFTQVLGIQIRKCELIELELDINDFLDLCKKPEINRCQLMDFLQRETLSKGITDIPDTVRTGLAQLFFDDFAVGGFFIHAIDTDLETAQRFLEGFLEGTSNRHHFTH